MNTDQPSDIDVSEAKWQLSDGRAIQMVSLSGSKFELSDEAVNFFKSRERGIALCCVIGKFRSGKSYLMNKVMNLRQKKGFTVSPSVNACTRGLWIWTKPVILEKQNLEIFFMDTEGLDAPGKDQSLDSKLFALAVMVSSYFMFNSNGNIDEPSIESLSMITHIINNVAVSKDANLDSGEALYQLSQYAPSFLWILRNMILEMQDLKGRPVNAAMYLESSLTDVPQLGGQSRNLERSMEIRRAILNFVKSRDCVALIRPHKDEKILQRLQDVPDASIEPAFLEGVITIRRKILANCTQKVIDGVPITGPMIIAYLAQFIEAFNENTRPIVSTAWRALLESECEETLRKAITVYNEQNKEFLSMFPDGIDPLDLNTKRQEARDRCLEIFNGIQYIQSRDEGIYRGYFETLMTSMNQLDEQVDEINKDLCFKRCEEQLDQIYGDYLKDPKWAGKTEAEIVQEFAEKHLVSYHETSPRIYNTAVLAKKVPELNRRFLEAFLKFKENEAKSKSRENERLRVRDNENLKAEASALRANEDLLEVAQKELERLRRKVEDLASGKGDEEIQRLDDELEKLKKENAELDSKMKTMGGKISELRAKIDDKTKKKKGFC